MVFNREYTKLSIVYRSFILLTYITRAQKTRDFIDVFEYA